MLQEQDRNQRPGGFLNDARNGFAAFWFVITVLARAWGVFVRRNTGHEYIGFAGILVPVLALLWAENFHSRAGRPEAMYVYIAAFLCACVVQRISHFQRRLHGEYIHSGYIGDSIFAKFFPDADPEEVRNHYEPILLAMISMSVMAITNSPVLGLFLVVSATASSMETFLLMQRDRRIVDQMRDRMWEQRAFVDRLHGRSDEMQVVEAEPQGSRPGDAAASENEPSGRRRGARGGKAASSLARWLFCLFGTAREPRLEVRAPTSRAVAEQTTNNSPQTIEHRDIAKVATDEGGAT